MRLVYEFMYTYATVHVSGLLDDLIGTYTRLWDN